jgi:uncharacterized phosphosugar-binding protein
MSTDRPTPDAQDYLALAHSVIDRMATSQADAMREAALAIEACIRNDGVVHSFGTGHSAGLAMEVSGRAGGLIATNLLQLQDIIIYGGASPQSLSWYSERDLAKAGEVLDLTEVHPADLFVVISNSGANGSIVELATRAKAGGHTVIAFTSLDHSTRVVSGHPSGKRLFEIADVVIDNCAPFGDSALELRDGTPIAPVSSLTTVVAVQMVMTDVIAALTIDGSAPPIYLSANIPGGDEHNEALVAHYGTRIRREAFAGTE